MREAGWTAAPGPPRGSADAHTDVWGSRNVKVPAKGFNIWPSENVELWTLNLKPPTAVEP
jgi:hypothetical protein